MSGAPARHAVPHGAASRAAYAEAGCAEDLGSHRVAINDMAAMATPTQNGIW